MRAEFTAVYRKVAQGYVGYVEELPGANAQGATLEEARMSLEEAVFLVLQANREMASAEDEGAQLIREPLKVDR